MTETKNTHESGEENEDWAVLPFDEAEDDARWVQFSAEMEGFEREVDAHEAVHGKILMKEDFSRFAAGENVQSISKDDQAFEDNLF
jgi:hypothetical protein